jgi:hypothetical protein
MWISDNEISIQVSILQLLRFEIGVFFKFFRLFIH